MTCFFRNGQLLYKNPEVGHCGCEDYVSINETLSDKTVAFSSYSQANGIIVRGILQDESIAVYNAAGQLVATAVAGEGETAIPLPASGTYIVKAAGKAVKVVL